MSSLGTVEPEPIKGDVLVSLLLACAGVRLFSPNQLCLKLSSAGYEFPSFTQPFDSLIDVFFFMRKFHEIRYFSTRRKA